MRKIVKTILITAGAFLIIGTAGASDLEQLTIMQTAIRLAAGFGMVVLGTKIQIWKRKRGRR